MGLLDDVMGGPGGLNPPRPEDKAALRLARGRRLLEMSGGLSRREAENEQQLNWAAELRAQQRAQPVEPSEQQKALIQQGQPAAEMLQKYREWQKALVQQGQPSAEMLQKYRESLLTLADFRQAVGIETLEEGTTPMPSPPQGTPPAQNSLQRAATENLDAALTTAYAQGAVNTQVYEAMQTLLQRGGLPFIYDKTLTAPESLDEDTRAGLTKIAAQFENPKALTAFDNDDLMTLAFASSPLLAEIARLDNAVYAALIVYPCHKPECRRYMETGNLCNDQVKRGGTMLPSLFKVRPEFRPRRLHKFGPDDSRPGTCTCGSEYMQTWLETGRLPADRTVAKPSVAIIDDPYPSKTVSELNEILNGEMGRGGGVRFDGAEGAPRGVTASSSSYQSRAGSFSVGGKEYPMPPMPSGDRPISQLAYDNFVETLREEEWLRRDGEAVKDLVRCLAVGALRVSLRETKLTRTDPLGSDLWVIECPAPSLDGFIWRFEGYQSELRSIIKRPSKVQPDSRTPYIAYDISTPDGQPQRSVKDVKPTDVLDGPQGWAWMNRNLQLTPPKNISTQWTWRPATTPSIQLGPRNGRLNRILVRRTSNQGGPTNPRYFKCYFYETPIALPSEPEPDPSEENDLWQPPAFGTPVPDAKTSRLHTTFNRRINFVPAQPPTVAVLDQLMTDTQEELRNWYFEVRKQREVKPSSVWVNRDDMAEVMLEFWLPSDTVWDVLVNPLGIAILCEQKRYEDPVIRNLLEDRAEAQGKDREDADEPPELYETYLRGQDALAWAGDTADLDLTQANFSGWQGRPRGGKPSTGPAGGTINQMTAKLSGGSNPKRQEWTFKILESVPPKR